MSSPSSGTNSFSTVCESTQTLLSFGPQNLTLTQIDEIKKILGFSVLSSPLEISVDPNENDELLENELNPAIVVLPPGCEKRKVSIATIDTSSDDDEDDRSSDGKPKPYKNNKNDKGHKKHQSSASSSSDEEEEEVEPLGEPEPEPEQEGDISPEDQEGEDPLARELSTKASQLSSIVKTLTCRKCNDSGVPVFHEFEMIRTLGHGAFGKVKLAKNLKTGELFAVKQIKRFKNHFFFHHVKF